MTYQPPLDVAFAHPAAPSFADLIRRLEADETLSLQRRRDLISALRRGAKALGRAPEDVPADLRWLRPRLAKLVPVALGISAKTWTNLLSDVKAALARCGIGAGQVRISPHLSDDWSPLWDLCMAANDPALTAGLGRFVRVLNHRKVAPCEVSDEHAAVYREALELNEISKDPERTVRDAQYAWNRAEARFPEWPRHRFPIPSRRDLIILPESTFPVNFLEELGRYLAKLGNPDPLDDHATRKPLRPGTLELRRWQVLHFASALVRMGEPPESLTGLATLVEPECAERGLRWLYDRAGRKTHSLYGMAEMLRLLARDHIKVDAATQAKFDRLSRNLKVTREPGLTKKNRDRLRQLDDPAALRRLVLLPKRLMAAADEQEGRRRAPLLREMALTVGLFAVCPIRIGNLRQIHLERNLHRPGDGRVFLVFEAHEVKNGRRIEFELPKRVVELIDQHVASRSPLLCPEGTPWLFPRRDGEAPIDQEHLAKRVRETIRRETGLDMNPHLFRHLAAKLWLKAHPGRYEELRRLLGHSELSMTIEAYAGFEAGSAAAAFAKLIEAKMEGDQ